MKQVFHYTFFYKTGHLKMDANLRRGGGQQFGQAGEKGVPLTLNDERNRQKIREEIKTKKE